MIITFTHKTAKIVIDTWRRKIISYFDAYKAVCVHKYIRTLFIYLFTYIVISHESRGDNRTTALGQVCTSTITFNRYKHTKIYNNYLKDQLHWFQITHQEVGSIPKELLLCNSPRIKNMKNLNFKTINPVNNPFNKRSSHPMMTL
jgi:hypothetical protein